MTPTRTDHPRRRVDGELVWIIALSLTFAALMLLGVHDVYQWIAAVIRHSQI